MPVGAAQGFSTLAFLLLALGLVLDVRYRKPVIGAFITPLAVATLVPGLLLQEGQAPLSPELRQPLLPLHITIALVGMAAFAVAAGVGVMYLLMERQVKGKRFGLLFSRLPSLEFLDTLNRRLVVVGFIALSVTLATGAFFVARLQPGADVDDGRQGGGHAGGVGRSSRGWSRRACSWAGAGGAWRC